MDDSSRNYTYPVNSRRLTRADVMSLFGSFGNEREGMSYAIDISIGVDTRFIVANADDTSLFVANDSKRPWEDLPGDPSKDDPGTDADRYDESTGFRYTDWNYLTATELWTYGSDTILDGSTSKYFFILFPQLRLMKNGITIRGKKQWDSSLITAKNTIIANNINNITNENDIRDNFVSIRNNITSEIKTKLLPVLDIYKDYNDGFIDDVSVKLYTFYTKFLESPAGTVRLNTFKKDASTYINNLFDVLQDDYYTPINAAMLAPKYIFDSDILPDGDFSYSGGVYEYRKFYSYSYSTWYWLHSLYWWWRPWGLSWWGSYWYTYWWAYHWYWHSWYWYYRYYYLNWYYQPSTSSTNEGERVRMCNVFKYNTYYPKEFIPMDALSYYTQYVTGGIQKLTDADVEKYIKYLTTTYKANIYKVNSHIHGVNKMVDKLLVVCEYAIYDYNKELAMGYGVNYNIIYDAYPTIGLTDANAQKNPNKAKNDIKIIKAYDSSFIKIAGEKYPRLTADQSLITNFEKFPVTETDGNKRIISVFNTVNGLDITTRYKNYTDTSTYEYEIARSKFPIKPIYLLLTPAQENNTNKIIQYKINLYQYGNIKPERMLTFIIYQMPKLITTSFTFSCNGYEIRKDTFGILGNVNNKSSYAAANVNIITREEFDEGECRQYHMAFDCNGEQKKEDNGFDNALDSTDVSTNKNAADKLYVNKNTPYKFGVRRFYNGTATIESKYNLDIDNGIISLGTLRSILSWPTYEYGELPILALNDQSEITIFLSTISSEKYTHNSSVSVSFSIKTEDYSVNTTVSMSGNSAKFKSNNVYNATNNAGNPLHWGENITGTNARAYPDESYGNTKRNNNANVMFSSRTGYRIYLKSWYTSSQTETKEISINGKRIKVTFIWVNLGVVGSYGQTSKFWHTGDCSK